MNSKEVVKRTVNFDNPDRMAVDFNDQYGRDIKFVNLKYSPDARPSKGVDEWGAVWENIGVCNLGEVKQFPLKTWDDFDKLDIPDPMEERRWEGVKESIEEHKEKYILASGVSIYERVHFIRSLESTWMDIYENPDKLCMLIDILTDMNLKMIEKYAQLGADGYIFADDWGLQNSLMVSPKSWREIWKPRYEKIYKKCHEHGLDTFLHSCGYISEILEDLIEVGLDVIQMDQQENMGLDELSEFKGRLNFYCPVDIQQTMVHGSMDEIREYCNKLWDAFGSTKGGLIAKIYADPKGAGHRKEAIDNMCDEFLKISKREFGK